MSQPDRIEFTEDDVSPVVDRMEEMAGRHRGWINLEPEPGEEEEESASLFALFSSAGPTVPVCTWMPGKFRRNRLDPTSVGLQHSAGPKVASTLAQSGLAVPDGWRVVQDHPRRGLVALVPDTIPEETILQWLMRAAILVAKRPLTRRWVASVYP